MSGVGYHIHFTANENGIITCQLYHIDILHTFSFLIWIRLSPFPLLLVPLSTHPEISGTYLGYLDPVTSHHKSNPLPRYVVACIDIRRSVANKWCSNCWAKSSLASNP